MQYRTALLGAACGQLVACVWAGLLLLGLCGCGEEESPPMPRPAGDEPSTELSRFAFEPADNPQLTAAAVAEVSGQDVSVDVPFGTLVTALVPRIEHRGASVAPESGVAQDYSEPVDYTVTASDGSETTYSVTVNVLSAVVQPGKPDAGAPVLDSTKQITKLSIAGVTATIIGDAIDLTVPHDTRLLNITPELVYQGAAILPSPLAPQDFRQPVVYTVMAQDGSTHSYTVNVTVAPNVSKAITHFRVFGIESTIANTDIALVLPAGTDVTMLEPTITLSGGTVLPPSRERQDFSAPVPYTVTGIDGSTRTYTVVVSLAAGNANDIMSFEIPSIVATIRGDEIQLAAPLGASDCNWAPTIVHAGVSIEPASGAPQDFLRGVVYTVSAGDGTQRRYTASCQITASSARGIASFEVLGLPATIIGDEITLTVPNAASLGSLTPTIVHHGARLSPASGVAQNFYNAVTYTLVEANGDKRTFSARIVNAGPADNELLAVMYDGRYAQLDGQRATLTLPFGSDVQALTLKLLHRGARVTPNAVARDFSTPQVYGVIARDGTRRDYEVSVRVAEANENALSELALLSVPGEIAGNEVMLQLPAGSDLRALAPTRLQHTGVSISPGVDQLQDFTQPVSYEVSAADGSVQTYVVRASVGER